MGFTSYKFLILFLPITLVAYFLCRRGGKNTLAKGVLAGASLIFYCTYGYVPLLILIADCIVNWNLSHALSKYGKDESGKGKKSLVLGLGIVLNVALLLYFKYFNFFAGNIVSLKGGEFTAWNIIQPAAISYYTFQQIAWLVDSSRGETSEYSFLDYAVFIFFFPKLIMGPIILHEEFIPQLNDSKRFRPDYENLSKGMIWFTVGLSKVLLIEPMFTFGVQYGFTVLSGLSIVEAWFCSLAFTLQLYFDFSGYCDMAAGMALMMNLDLPQNFNSPYKAVSIGDFWKCWHITLTRFLRKYIYFPLGGNRKGAFRTYLNIIIIFLVSGFWHGANWTFIVWGAIHGVIMVVERLVGISARDKASAKAGNPGMTAYIGNAIVDNSTTISDDKIFKSNSGSGADAGVSEAGGIVDGNVWIKRIITAIRRIITFIIVDIAWIFFRADSLSDAVAFIKQMFIPDNIMPDAQFYNSFGLNDFAFATRHLNIFVPMLFAGALAMVFFGKNIYETKYKPTLLTAIVTAVLFLASFVCLGNAADFIYFKF